MIKHGVYVYERETSVSAPSVAATGIPFVVGAAPVQSAESPLPAGEPVLVTSYADGVEKLGYSDDWEKYNLCEFLFSHFVLYGRQPVIFNNLLDPENMSAAAAASDIQVEDNKAKLPLEAINDERLVVKAAGGTGSALERGKDYEVFYAGQKLVIELVPSGAAYGADKVNVEYRAVTPSSVDTERVAIGMQDIEKCLSSVGIVPDLICSPGYSSDPLVAAVMATKAAGINGLFSAKALVDISSDEKTGAATFTGAIAMKALNNFVDVNQIVCWPMCSLGGRVFHMSTQLAGLIAEVDSGNQGVPYESPSNKPFKCDTVVLKSGRPVSLTHPQANILEAQGVVTALRFLSGLVCWGNYTACYPGNTDAKDFFIPISRMFDWVGNTVIRTFWIKVDKPMDSRRVGNIMDTCNIWLNGLVGMGYILGARVEAREDGNPETNIVQGIVQIHIYMAPPPPMKEINFILEYDVGYLASALAA